MARTRATQGGTYRVFGLTVASPIALPELARSRATKTDVTIRRGAVRPSATGLVVEFPEARLCIEAGRTITVETAPGAAAEDLRLVLLGTVLGLVCHQRGLLPLHAAAVAAGGGATVFAGPSGAGKSTLAAHLQGQGRRILTDDLCAIDVAAKGGPAVWPGPRRIKLWGEALGPLGLAAEGLAPLSEGIDKFALPIPPGRAGRAARIKRIYVFEEGRDAAAAPLRLLGARAVEALIANVYRWSLARDAGLAPLLFERCVALARRCEVHAIGRFTDFAALAHANGLLRAEGRLAGSRKGS